MKELVVGFGGDHVCEFEVGFVDKGGDEGGVLGEVGDEVLMLEEVLEGEGGEFFFGPGEGREVGGEVGEPGSEVAFLLEFGFVVESEEVEDERF